MTVRPPLPAPDDNAATATASLPRALPIAGLALCVWAVIPPYLGPALDTDTRVEVVDHVVPGVVLLAVSSVAWVLGPRLRTPTIAPLVTGLAVLLVGLWMFATHVPLVAQALRDEVPAGAAAFHTAPTIAVTVFGLLWVRVGWRADVS